MKTTGATFESAMECLMQVEKIKEPAGDIQTLDPRPRPATCTVAVAVKPLGRCERSLVFLKRLGIPV
jgi:hypothetical protein